MRYSVADIEDQILCTLTRETLTGVISSSGTAITGVGTAFNTELTVGDVIVAPSDEITADQERLGTGLYTVATITDATNMTVTVAPSPALSGDKFALRYPDGEIFDANTYAGDLSASNFIIPQFMEGLVRRLPFILVQYLGRTSGKMDSNSIKSVYEHTLSFQLYVGAKSLRTGKEAARGAYVMLANTYDRLHGRAPVMASGQVLPSLTRLEGVPITTSEFNPLSPLMETGGSDERLIVNLPEIKVYSSSYKIKLVA